MASSSEVFPAPVCPVIAKRSKQRKSISLRSRKEVNPSSSSFIGRILCLVIQPVKRLKRLGRDGQVPLFPDNPPEELQRALKVRRGPKNRRSRREFLLDRDCVRQRRRDLLRQTEYSRPAPPASEPEKNPPDPKSL